MEFPNSHHSSTPTRNTPSRIGIEKQEENVSMKRSTDRILVTHVGSLARPKDLMEMLVARNEGKVFDADVLAKRAREAVAAVVQKQIDCGVDIVNDGELGKSNFSRYARERLSGFVERP